MRSSSQDLTEHRGRLPASARSEEGHNALLLATAIAIGLLFAGTLTVFGEPLTHSLKDLALKDPAQPAALADPIR